MITLQTMPSEFAREDYSATFLGRHTYQAVIRTSRPEMECCNAPNSHRNLQSWIDRHNVRATVVRRVANTLFRTYPPLQEQSASNYTPLYRHNLQIQCSGKLLHHRPPSLLELCHREWLQLHSLSWERSLATMVLHPGPMHTIRVRTAVIGLDSKMTSPPSEVPTGSSRLVHVVCQLDQKE